MIGDLQKKSDLKNKMGGKLDAEKNKLQYSNR
jgi:hypothetical protein